MALGRVPEPAPALERRGLVLALGQVPVCPWCLNPRLQSGLRSHWANTGCGRSVRSFVLDPRPGAQTHIGLGHLDKDRMVGALLQQPVDAGATGLNVKQRHQAELSSSRKRSRSVFLASPVCPARRRPGGRGDPRGGHLYKDTAASHAEQVAERACEMLRVSVQQPKLPRNVRWPAPRMRSVVVCSSTAGGNKPYVPPRRLGTAVFAEHVIDGLLEQVKQLNVVRK